MSNSKQTKDPVGYSLDLERLPDPNLHIFPNPFNEKTTLFLTLETETNVKIELFDNMGQHIKSIANFISISGSYEHEINFKELGLRPGMYFISVAIDGKVTNSKVVFTK